MPLKQKPNHPKTTWGVDRPDAGLATRLPSISGSRHGLPLRWFVRSMANFGFEKKLICLYLQTGFIFSAQRVTGLLSRRSTLEGEIGKDGSTSDRHSWSDRRHLAQPDTAMISVVGTRHNQVNRCHTPPTRIRTVVFSCYLADTGEFLLQISSDTLFPRLMLPEDLLCVWHSIRFHKRT